MKTIFKLVMASFVLGMMAIAAFAGTTPDIMHISCKAPKPDKQEGLHRPKGDSDIWTFQIELDDGAHFVKGPYWSYPGKDGNDPDWGLWTGGDDGDSSLGWSSPGKTGTFSVRVSGQISCGNGDGGKPIDFEAGWDGSVIEAHLEKVEFYGSNYHVIQDDGTPYPSAEWQDMSDPPNYTADDQGDHKFPLCYPIQSLIYTNVYISVAGDAPQDGDWKVRGHSNTGIDFPTVNATLDGGNLFAKVQSSNPLPSTVAFINPLIITWEVSSDGGDTWTSAGTSSNRVYVVLHVPFSPVESVLNLSCTWATGLSSDADIMAAIWSHLSGANEIIRRKPVDGYNNPDGVQITYWIPPGSPQTSVGQSIAEMLTNPYGRGSCIAWSELFQYLGAVQGIQGISLVDIFPKTPGDSGFLIKQWNFGKHIRTGQNGICDTTATGDDVQILAVGQASPDAPCIGPGPNGTLDTTSANDDVIADGMNVGNSFPYFVYGDNAPNGDVADQFGVPGQGNPNPPGGFLTHTIVDYNNKFYDPSYGHGPIDIAQANEYENLSIDGFQSSSLTARKNDPNTQELHYQAHY